MKIKMVIVFALLMGVLPLQTPAADAPAGPVILIYNTVGFPPPPPPDATNVVTGPRLVAALWGDGKIIWSDQRIAGGPPYFHGRFDAKKLEALLGSLQSQSALTNAAFPRLWFGPDSSTMRIAVNDGQYHLALESWHESFEQSSNLVATAQSVRSLEGRSRDEVLREQPADYRQFRSAWREIRDKVAEMTPAQGEPFTDKLPAMNW